MSLLTDKKFRSDFASQVRLDEHQRAADYTIARAHFGIIETLISAIFIHWHGSRSFFPTIRLYFPNN
jgi:hypothetical protein